MLYVGDQADEAYLRIGLLRNVGFESTKRRDTSFYTKHLLIKQAGKLIRPT